MNKLIEALVTKPLTEDEQLVKEAMRLSEVGGGAEALMGAHNPDDWEVDPDSMGDAMRQIGDRFKDERIKGWQHPETGVVSPPADRESVEARWQAAEPKFRQVLSKYDPMVQKRLRLWKRKQKQGTAGTGTAGAVCPHCGK